MAPPAPDAVARLLRERVRTSGPLELEASGSSMGRVIASGSIVSVHAAERPRRGEIWAFVDDEGQVLVHRIRSIDGETLIGRGVGNRRDDLPLTIDRTIGRVASSLAPDGSERAFGEVDRVRADLRFRLRGTLRTLQRRLSRVL